MNRIRLATLLVAAATAVLLAWWGGSTASEPAAEQHASRPSTGTPADLKAPTTVSLGALSAPGTREQQTPTPSLTGIEVEFVLRHGAGIDISAADATISVESGEGYEFLSLRAGEPTTASLASDQFEVLSLVGRQGMPMDFEWDRTVLEDSRLRVQIEPLAIRPWRIEVVSEGTGAPIPSANVELFGTVDVARLGAYQYMLDKFAEDPDFPSPDSLLRADARGAVEIPKEERALLVRVSAEPYETYLGVLEPSQTRKLIPLGGRGSLRVTLPNWALTENFRLRVLNDAKETLCDVTAAETDGTHELPSVAPGAYTCQIARPSSLCIGRVVTEMPIVVSIAEESLADLTAEPSPTAQVAGAIIIASFDEAPDTHAGLRCKLQRISVNGEFETIHCESSDLSHWERDAQYDARNFRLMLPDIEPGHYLATLEPLGVSASFEAIDGQSAEIVIDATQLVDLSILADWGKSTVNDPFGAVLWRYADDESSLKHSRTVHAGEQITIAVRPGVVEVQVVAQGYEAKTVVVDCSTPGENQSVTLALAQLEAAARDLQLLGANGEPLALSMEQWGEVRYRREGTDRYSFKKSLGVSELGVFDPTYCRIYLVDGVRYEIELPALAAEGVDRKFTRFVTATEGLTRTAVAIPGS